MIGLKKDHAFHNNVWRFLQRLPMDIVWMLIYCLCAYAWHLMMHPTDRQCSVGRFAYSTAAVIFCIIINLSFFACIPCLSVLSVSPLIRQLHQLTSFVYTSEFPPKMLYVTDGGVSDNTTIGQLLLRKRRRILSVISSGDCLADLKVVLDWAEKERVATFYDPAEPKKSVFSILDRYEKDTSMEYMHIGICYSWGDEEGTALETGDLYVVTRRLPKERRSELVRPPITEDEIVTGKAKVLEVGVDWGDMTTDMLGCFPCCDCCHRNNVCNCQPKFPHGASSNLMFMSPAFFSSLVRLGFDISGEAVQSITKKTKKR